MTLRRQGCVFLGLLSTGSIHPPSPQNHLPHLDFDPGAARSAFCAVAALEEFFALCVIAGQRQKLILRIDVLYG